MYVLPTGFSSDLPRPPATALGRAVQAPALLIEHRLIEASRRAPDGVDAHRPAAVPADGGAGRFSHSDELIERADTATEDAQSPTMRHTR